MRSPLITVIATALFLLSGCATPYVYPANGEPVACSDFLPFFQEPMGKRAKDLRASTLDRQYQLYICGMQYVRPPLMGFAWDFASHGRASAEYLKDRLSAAPNDFTVENIAFALYIMNDERYYDVAGDLPLMHELDAAIGKMEDQKFKRSAASWRTGIVRLDLDG